MATLQYNHFNIFSETTDPREHGSVQLELRETYNSEEGNYAVVEKTNSYPNSPRPYIQTFPLLSQAEEEYILLLRKLRDREDLVES